MLSILKGQEEEVRRLRKDYKEKQEKLKERLGEMFNLDRFVALGCEESSSSSPQSEESDPSETPSTETEEEDEEAAEMAAPPAPDPLRNIPNFLGDDTKDTLTARQHIEAFEDYLWAYGLYRYDGIGPGAGQAPAQQARAREIVNRLGFSLQEKVKTWFHEKTLFANPMAPAIADYDGLKQQFLIWFNLHDRTQQELNIECENIKADDNWSIEAIWERIQTIG